MKLKLIDMGAIFSHKETQDDVLFKFKGKEKEVQVPGSYALRVRQTGTKSLLSYKELTDKVGCWIEHETQLSNASEMIIILKKIGMVEVLTVKKQREHGKLGNVNICLDNIEEMGEWIELETIGEDHTKSGIHEIFGKLGFSEEEIVHEGYVALLFKKQGIEYRGTG